MMGFEVLTRDLFSIEILRSSFFSVVVKRKPRNMKSEEDQHHVYDNNGAYSVADDMKHVQLSFFPDERIKANCSSK